MPALKANAKYQKRYPLVSALSRPLIVRHLVRVAKELSCDTVAHGCTGKGNDQVRFEAGVLALAPELSNIAPIRDLALTRDKAIAYAEEHNLPIEQSKKNPYSIDKNVWGRTSKQARSKTRGMLLETTSGNTPLIQTPRSRLTRSPLPSLKEFLWRWMAQLSRRWRRFRS